MTCKKIQRRLSAFLDGELDQDLARRIQEHVDSCPDCAAELARLQKVWQLLGTLPPVQAPPFFAARVLAVAKKKRERKSRSLGELFIPRPLLPVAVSVGILAGILMGSWLGQLLMGTHSQASETFVTQVATDFDNFGDLPPGSLSEVYVALASSNNSK